MLNVNTKNIHLEKELYQNNSYCHDYVIIGNIFSFLLFLLNPHLRICLLI